MKNTALTQTQRDLVNEYYEFSKTVVISNFHFADGKEICTGYSLEDAYQEGTLALCRATAHFNENKGVSFKTYAAAVIRNHLKKVMFSRRITEYPLESVSDSPLMSYEINSKVEYEEMMDFIQYRANDNNASRALSYRILTDKVFRHVPMTVIADKHHLKKSAAYKHLNDACCDFRNSYLMNEEQALST